MSRKEKLEVPLDIVKATKEMEEKYGSEVVASNYEENKKLFKDLDSSKLIILPANVKWEFVTLNKGSLKNKCKKIIKMKNTPYPIILFTIFLILKLTNNIDWSWWWITSPLWVTFLGVLLILRVALFIDTYKD